MERLAGAVPFNQSFQSTIDLVKLAAPAFIKSTGAFSSALATPKPHCFFGGPAIASRELHPAYHGRPSGLCRPRLGSDMDNAMLVKV